MSFTTKEGRSYIDGIPVKISENCRPPPKISLPSYFQNRFNTDIFNLSYDFSLENQIIEEAAKRREAEEAARIAEEKLAAEIAKSEPAIDDIEAQSEVSNDNHATDCLPNEAPNSALPVQNRDVHIPPNTSRAAAMTEILTPLPSTNIVSPSNGDSNGSSNLPVHNFNPADFEGDTSSPFDNMELKTINELEELSTVFQKIAPQSSENAGKPDKWNTPAPVSCSSADYNSQPSYVQQSTTAYQHLPHYQNSSSSSFIHPMFSQNYCAPANKPIHTEPKILYTSSPMTNNFEVQNYFTEEVTRYSPVTVNYDYTMPAGRNLRNSKSFSDLASMDDEVAATMSRGVPSDPIQKRPKSVELQNKSEVGYKDSASKMNHDNPANDSHQNDDNFSKDLTNEQVKHVKYFTAMGFPCSRVTRAVQHLESDDKKILDWLCQAQKLTEMGFCDTDIEDAMEAYDSNEEKAKEFLELLSQLKEFGFEKSAVKEALITSNNDRDKALDVLVS